MTKTFNVRDENKQEKKIVNRKRFFEIRDYQKENNIRMEVKVEENFHKKVEKKENR